MKYSQRMNRHERREMQATRLATSLGGSGIYVYENNTDGDLKLPKATASGLRVIGPRKRFQGDSYFMKWVGHPMNLLRFIEEIVPKGAPANQETIKEGTMPTEKLILDQPDTVTTKGKIEHVVETAPKAMPINDAVAPAQSLPEVLLTENPLDGVEIIKG